MKKDFFRLQEHGTTAKREVLAGITTFMTMAYVLAVQPAAIWTTRSARRSAWGWIL